MPEEAVITSDASVQSTPAVTESDLESALAGGVTPKASVPSSVATPAHEAGKPTKAAPVVEQPGKAVDASTDKTETPAEAEVDLLAELGLEKEQEETVEVVKKRYEESSREAHRLAEERKAMEAHLAEIGIEVVKTRKGYQLKATEKYKNELKDDDIPDVLKQLNEEERKLVDPDIAKKIQKLTLSETLAKRPPVSEQTEPKVISEVEIGQVFRNLTEAKLGDKPLFPAFSEPDVVDTMRRIYQSPTMSKFAEWMQQDTSNYDVGLRMLYGSAWRVIAPVRAKRAAQEASKKQEIENKGKAGSVTSSGGGVKSNAMNTSGKPETDSQRIAREIATSI